jgi:alkanesulfonate monooxygenase SsuD/methylene tetrahydromethanopterin reductase-like flavin-dependent oxidoreductase (luciferase family)
MQWNRPLARLRDTLTAVRALLAGERLPNPAPGARPLRLGALPEVPVPIALAALSPASIRLAGELADAWSPFLWSRSRLAEGRALLQEGEARAQSDAPTQVSAAVPVALAATEEAARRLAGWWLGTYATRMGPLYPRMLAERFGMGAALAAVVARAGENREPDLPAGAEELAEEVTLFGTYDRARESIAAWVEAGADSVHLVLPPGRPEEELLNLVEVAASVSSSMIELR